MKRVEPFQSARQRERIQCPHPSVVYPSLFNNRLVQGLDIYEEIEMHPKGIALSAQ